MRRMKTVADGSQLRKMRRYVGTSLPLNALTTASPFSLQKRTSDHRRRVSV